MSDREDPRVLFTAERTLLTWNCTAVGPMGFGFLVERFGLFLSLVVRQPIEPLHRGTSLVIGVAMWRLPVCEYRQVIRTLWPSEVPAGYWVHGGVLVNRALAVVVGFLVADLVRL